MAGLLTVCYMFGFLFTGSAFATTTTPVPDPEYCVGDMLSCDPPDDSCLHKSNRCDGELDCMDLTNSDEVACPTVEETFCADGFVRVPGANDGYCYHLRPIEYGTLNFTDALCYCNELMAYLPRPNSLSQVENLGDWMNITGDPIPGYWMGYKRNLFAPLVNGTLTEENRANRKDKSLFVDIYSMCPQVEMPPELWRSPNQPGEKSDERDEQCVAKKRVGSDAPSKFVGADDYSCMGQTQEHYVICERCVELLPEQHQNTTG